MPVPVAPTAAVAGQAARAGIQFNNLAAQVAFLLDPPVVFAYQGTTATAVATGTLTVLPMDTELVDTDNVHSTSTNTSRLTIVTAGRYRVTGQIGYAVNGTGYRSAAIAKNGTNTAITAMNSIVAIATYVQVVDEVLCAVGDYIELSAQQNSGVALNTVTGANQTFLKARWAGVS